MFEFRVRLVVSIAFSFVIAFLASRVSLLLIYSDVFSVLTAGQVLRSFLSGLKFDLATIFTFAGIPLFMLGLPVPGRKWAKLWTFLIMAEFLAMALILIGDIIFFEHVKRHIADELRLIGNDMDFIVKFALSEHPVIVILIFSTFAFSLFLVNKAIDKLYSPPKLTLWSEPLKLLFLAAFIILSVMGWKIEGKPVNVVDAFDYSNSEYGNLVLNGVFTSYQSIRSSKNIRHDFFEKDSAIREARRLIVTEEETVIDDNFPLMRVRNGFSVGGERYNVVFILLESWSFKFIDSFSGSKYGVTPNLDELARGGLMFTNFYATGQRSIFGIEAALTGIPAVPGLSYLGKGLELANISRLAAMLNEKGYASLFMQTSSRSSFRLSGIAFALGSDEYYGSQDIPVIYPYKGKTAPSWGYDYDGLQFLLGRIEKVKKPFFAFFFTGTTHAPFVFLDDRFEKHPRTEPVNGFLNSLYYSDYALGEFFRAARKSDWFDNTIFIMTADHALGQFQKNTVDEKFKIPLVIYCPKLFGHRTSGVIGSQADILPTIIELLNIKSPYSAAGKSLLKGDSNRFAFFVEGDNIGLINEKGYLKHNLKNRLETSFTKASDIEEAEKTLLSIDEAVYSLLKDNRWHK